MQNTTDKQKSRLGNWFVDHPRAKKWIAGALAAIMLCSVCVIGVSSVLAERREKAAAAAEEAAAAAQNATTPESAESDLQTNSAVRVNTPEELAQQAAAEAADAFGELVDKTNAALAVGAYDLALGYAEDCRELADDDAKLALSLALRGNALFYLEQYADSAQCYRDVMAMEHENFSDVELTCMVVRCLLLQGELQAALDECSACLVTASSEDATLSELYALRGTAYMTLSSYELAVEDFHSAIELGYENPEILYEQISQCEYLLNDYDATITSAEQAGGNADELLALSYYVSGDYARAAAAYEQLLTAGAQNFSKAQLYSCVAKCRVLLRQYDEAISACASGLALNDAAETAALYALRGSAYMAKGENLAAAQDFDRAVQSGYSDPETLRSQAALCYYFSASYENAIRCGEAAGGGENDLWVGLSYYMLQDFANAAVWVEKALPLDQSYCEKGELYRIVTRCCLLTEAYDRAVEFAKAGIAEINASATPNQEILGEIYALGGAALLSLGRYEEALTEFNAAVAAGYGSLYEVYKQCLLCHFLSGSYENAVESARLALECGTGTADLYYWEGLSWFSLQQYEKARDALTKAQQLDDRQENLYFYLGVCHFSLEDYTTAIAVFTTSVDRAEPAAARSLYNRGLCYLQLEDYDKAGEDLQAAAQAGDEAVATDAQTLLESLKAVVG